MIQNSGILKKISAVGIVTYQKFFSPDTGLLFSAGIFKQRNICVFYPTCSEYAKGAIEKYGFIRGLAKSMWRILRCHPWQKNHIDLP